MLVDATSATEMIAVNVDYEEGNVESKEKT